MIEIPTYRVFPLCKAFSIVFLLISFISCTGTKGEPFPDQPIAFNHKIHAGDYQIPCLYCHAYVNRGPVAGIPAVKTCMGCHDLISTDHDEVAKLSHHWEERRPIEWVKVYDLPDFVRFNHNRHVSADVHCEACHGSVAEMPVIERYSEMSMGWCLECHEKRDADIDCLTCHY